MMDKDYILNNFDDKLIHQNANFWKYKIYDVDIYQSDKEFYKKKFCTESFELFAKLKKNAIQSRQFAISNKYGIEKIKNYLIKGLFNDLFLVVVVNNYLIKKRYIPGICLKQNKGGFVVRHRFINGFLPIKNILLTKTSPYHFFKYILEKNRLKVLKLSISSKTLNTFSKDFKNILENLNSSNNIMTRSKFYIENKKQTLLSKDFLKYAIKNKIPSSLLRKNFNIKNI